MLTRRTLLKSSSLAIRAGLLPLDETALPTADSDHVALVYLSLNEGAFGPSPRAVEAVRQTLWRLNWYADAASAAALTSRSQPRRECPQSRS